MPVERHLEILLDGTYHWNEWRKLQSSKVTPDLSRANLKGRNLVRADFSSTNLTEAELDDADLKNANLSKANLDGAQFIHANLTNANLENATVAGTSFGMANLIGAKLPAVLNNFIYMLKNVEETSKNARKIFLSLLGLCAFTLLTTATVSDAQIILNNFRLKLPIIGADVPVILFFITMPMLGFFIFFYMHLYLAHIWELVAELPRCFPDGLPLRRKLYPWMVNLITDEWRTDRTMFGRLQEKLPTESENDQTKNQGKDRFLLYRWRASIAVFLAFYSFPFTMLMVIARFPIRENLFLNFCLWALSIVATLVGFHFHMRAIAVVKSEKPDDLQKNKGNLILLAVLLGGIIVVGKIPNCLFKKLPLNEPNIQLRAADLNGFVFGDINLSGANLRYAKLNHADFRNTNLQNADLRGAELKSAELNGAEFDSADVAGADFTGATGLTASQLAKAKNPCTAKLDSTQNALFREKFPELCPDSK